jgi:hypothetical protein
MKILILLNHSSDNRALAEITETNTWRYSARHGYDVMWLREPWDSGRAAVRVFDKLLQLLPLYDAIVTIGSDVLFMNHAVRFEDIIRDGDEIVMAHERLGEQVGYSSDGFSPINNDVVIWRNTPFVASFVEDLIDRAGTWLKLRFFWQQYLADMFLSDGKVEGIRFVDPRVMNACLQKCSGRYKPGDFILHLLALDYETKCVMATIYQHQVIG